MVVDDEMDLGIDPEEVLENKIKNTVEYLIRHDEAEIENLLIRFKDYDDNLEIDVVCLSQLVVTWIEEQVTTEKNIPNIFSGN